MSEKQPEIKRFDKCPACGSKNRYLEGMANQLKVRGIARKEWTFCKETKTGAVLDEATASKIPIGSKVPAYSFDTDICSECGCIYALKLAWGTATIQPNIAKPQIKFPDHLELPGLGGNPGSN